MKQNKKKKLSGVISVRLFIAVFIAFIVSSSVSYLLMRYYCDRQARELLSHNSEMMAFDIEEHIKQNLYETTTRFLAQAYYEDGEEAAMEQLDGVNYTYFAKKDGTIFLAGNKDFIGKNIRDIQYMADIMDVMIESFDEAGTDEGGAYQTTPVPVKTLDGKLDVYYMLVGDPNYPDVFLASAWVPETYDEVSYYAALSVIASHEIGLNGHHIMITTDNSMISPYGEYYMQPFPYTKILETYENGTDNRVEDFAIHFQLESGEVATLDTKQMIGVDKLWDTNVYYCLTKVYGLYDCIIYPVNEVMAQANNTIVILMIVEVIIFAVLFIVLNSLIRHRMVKKLDTVNNSLAKITNGNLDERVEVRDTCEFDSLSTDINTTVDRLKGYIAEAAARIDADLAVAKAIQSSALPNVFPPFPERTEFELFASMNAAKEVGGDFYDFYMLNDSTLGFLIADVSGKSIPGAMFMMTAKTVIKSLAESGLPPAEVFTQANEKLCEGNDAEMFVTAWLGYLDLNTGLVRVANAGHNPPILIRDGKAEYVILKPGLMLAGMDGIRYKEQTVQLEKGDILYLFTDGVTEAMNKSEDLYGEERLQELLSFGEKYPEPTAENGTVESVCKLVSGDLAVFTDGAEQSDDITMLCIKYLGGD